MDHDLEIKCQGNIFDVQKVKLTALDHFIYIFCITELHHTPTGEPRFNP